MSEFSGKVAVITGASGVLCSTMPWQSFRYRDGDPIDGGFSAFSVI